MSHNIVKNSIERNSIVKKIWRDLSERKARTLLTLIGLIIGLWGIGSVAIAWHVLDNDLSENFTSTNPPAIVLTIKKRPGIDNNDSLSMDELANIKGVSTVENRPEIHGRIELYKDQWVPAKFWVVNDFTNMKVAKVFPETGTLSPSPGNIVIERDGLLFANWKLRMRVTGPDPHSVPKDRHGNPIPIKHQVIAQFGNKPITIRLNGGRHLLMSLSGTVHDPAQAPSRMEQVIYGYVTPETANSWTQGKLINRLLIVPSEEFSDDPAIRATASRLQKRLNHLGYEVTKINFPSTTEHVHQFQMNSILFLLAGIGILALLMSVVLVLNLINGILTAQIKQIGILKAIGSTHAKVAMIYLGSMLTLGLIASLVAIPLAIKSGYVLSGGLAAFLNFDILTTELSYSFLFGLFLLGTIFPVLAALAPIKRWTQVSVIDALQHSEATPDNDNKIMAKYPLPLPINIAMGVKNAFRKPIRLLLTAATVAIGLITFMVAMNMSSSLLYTAEQEETQKRFDLLVSFEQPIDAARVAWMDKFGIVEHAETWKTKAAVVIDDRGIKDEIRPLKLVPAASKVMRPKILDGNWLSLSQAGGVVINQRLSYARSEYRVGNRLTVRVNNQEVKLPIIGIMKEFAGSAIYMREADFRVHFPNADQLVNSAYITLKKPNEKTLSDLNLLLNQHFTLAGIGVSNMTSAKTASRIIRGHLDVIVSALLILALLMLFISTLGMASGISTSVVERTREIGILRAIGGKPSAIGTMLVSESMTMALMGWLLALVISQPTSRFMTDYFGTALVEYPFDYMGSTQGVYLSLSATIILVVLATIGPVFSVHRHAVKEAISYE